MLVNIYVKLLGETVRSLGVWCHSSPETSRQLLHLHAQAELVRQEATFQAALLVTELLVGERFWDSQPIVPETCHQQLAQLRLAAGQTRELAWRPARTVPGRSMMQVLLDRLLLQQGRDRAHLVQSLLTLAEPEVVRERGRGRKQMIPPGAGCSWEDTSPALQQEVIFQLLKLAQKRLQVARRAEASWQDCAVAVLTDLQREQLGELSRSIEDLAGIISGREGEACPALYERLLARLQEPPLMSLVQHLQPISPQEQQQQRPAQASLQVDQEACPTQALSTRESDASAVKKIHQREVPDPDAPQTESEREVQGSFPAQGEPQPEWEGLGLHPLRGPAGPDPQQIVHSDTEELKLQGMETEAGMPHTQARQRQKSPQLQRSPKPRQVPEGFQREPNVVGPQDMRDPRTFDPQVQNILETPHRQGDAQGPLGGLVPHASQKQQEIVEKFPQDQREVQVEPEVLDLQEKESPHPQGIPGTSEKKEPKAIRAGECGGLQDSPQQQETSQGPLRRKRGVSQDQKDRNMWGQQGGGHPEVYQASVVPGKDQNLPQDKGIRAQQGYPLDIQFQKLSLDSLQPHGELLRSKSLGSLEFIMSQAVLLQGLRDPYRGLQMPHLPGMQSREVGTLGPQTGGDHKYIPQRETEITQTDEMRKAMELEPQMSLKGKQQEPLVSQKQVDQQVYLQEPQPQEQRESKATQLQVKQEILQAHKDLYKESPTLQAPEMRSSEAPCNREQKVLERSQPHLALLRKSRSLEPQELSEAKTKVIWVSPQIWQEGRYPQAPQPQEWKEAKAPEISQAEREVLKCHDLREVLQHQKFLESKQEPIQLPEPLQKEPEASMMKERPEHQTLEAPLKETELPTPQAEKTEASQALMETGPLHAQEKLQRNLGRPQVTWPYAEKELEALPHQIDLARKAMSLESVEMSRSEGMRQLNNLHIPGMPQGRPQDHLQKELELLQVEGTVLEKPEILEALQTCKHLRTFGREQEALELQGYEGLQALQAQGQMGPEPFWLHGPELLQTSMQRDKGTLVFQEMGSPSLPEKKSLEATQDLRGPELSPLQNLPHYGILWRKSKSLELRRPPSFQPQELRELEVSCTQSKFPEMSPEALALQECGLGEDFQSQKLRQKPQSHHAEEPPLKEQEALQVQGKAQKGAKITGPQNVKETQDFSPKEGKGTEIYQSQETQPKNSKALDLREPLALQPHERKAQETAYAPGATPQRQTGIPEPQEFRSPETPPLLWRVLWQKAKSFELGKPHVLPSPVLEPSLAQEMPLKELRAPQLPQEMKRTSMVQPQEEPQMEPETQKPQELRESMILYPQRLKEPEDPQTQAEKVLQHQEERISGIPPEALVGQSNSLNLQPQEMRELGAPSVQKAPQRRTQILPQREAELLEHSGTFMEEELRGSQPHERKSLETVQTQEAVPQKETWIPQIWEDRSPESPPLLWRVLGLKAKSFELRKPCALEAQEQGSQVEPEAQKPQGCKDPNVISPQQLRESMAPQVQAEKESLLHEKMLPTCSQGLQAQEGRSPKIPQSEEAVPERLRSPTLQERQGFLGQETRELETPQEQRIPEIKTTRTSEVHQRVLEQPKDPAAVVQELGQSRVIQSYGSACLENLEAQGTSKMVLHPEECRSPETPPLLWRVLGPKAKSFELKKPYPFQFQDVRYLEPAFLAQRVSQKDLQAPLLQGMQRQQMVLPQGEPHLEPGSHASPEHGGPKILHPPELREQQAPHIRVGETFHVQGMMLTDLQPAGSQEERDPQIPLYQHGLLEDSQLEQALQPQEQRGLVAPEAQTDPQRSQMTSQSCKSLCQELGEPRAFQTHRGNDSDALQSQPAPEMEMGLLLLQKRRSPETPPLLWWALELAQQGRPYRELLASPQPQEVNKPRAIQLQGRPQRESEAQRPKELDQKILYSQELKELEAPRVQKKAFQGEGMVPTDILLQAQERREPKSPQLQEILLEADSTCPGLSASQEFDSQALRRAELTQSPKRSPQALEVQMLKEMEAVPIQEAQQVEREPQDTEGSPRGQKTLAPKEPKDLESSLPENMPEMCDSYKVSHSHVRESLEPRGEPDITRAPPISLQAQEMLKNDPEDCGPSDESQALHIKEMPLATAEAPERVKLDDCPALESLEGHSKTKGLLPPGRLLGKSRSLDLRELQALRAQELWGQESPQTQGMPEQRPKAFQVPEVLQMEPQKKNGPQAYESYEKSGQGVLQTQGTLQLLQPQGPDAESHPPLLQGPLEMKSEPLELMEPPALQSLELREVIVLQCQDSPPLDPENLTLQGTMDPKALCPQGHCKGKRCEFVVEDKRSEVQGILQRCPQMFFMPEASQPQAALLRKSKSLEPQELSEPCGFLLQRLRKPEILQTSGCAQEDPQLLRNQVLQGLKNCPLHVTTQMAKNPVHDMGILKNGTESPAQEERRGLETSQPQEELGDNAPRALNSQGSIQFKVQHGQKEVEALQLPRAPQMEHTPLRIQQMLQKNPESFALQSTTSKHSCVLQLEQEASLKMPPTLVKHGKSPTQLPLVYIETKPLPSSWWIPGKSKSLDVRELGALQSKPLVGGSHSSNLQNMGRLNICHPQTKLQDKLIEPQKSKGPMALHSQTLPLQELPQKDQEDPQRQEGNKCETRKTQQMEMGPPQVKEPLRNKREVLCPQELENAQIFCPKECRELEALPLQKYSPGAKEPLWMQEHAQGEPEPQGLMGPQLLDPQEKRDLQSPALLRNLLRKSKTLGPEVLKRSGVFQTQHAQSPESPRGHIALKLGAQVLQLQELVGQEPHNTQGLRKLGVLQHQEITTNIVEGIQETTGHLDSQRQAHKMKVETFKDQEPLHANRDLPHEQGHTSCVGPQVSLSQLLPPHDIPQFGIGLLQELGRLHNELEALRPQELKDEEAQDPLHQEWRGTESHQPPPIDQKVSEAHGRQHGQQQQTLQPSQQSVQGLCQTSGVLKRKSDRSPALKASQVTQLQEYLPKTSPVVPGVMAPHVLQSQESMEPKSLFLQESPQVGWEPLKAEGKVIDRELGAARPQEQHPFKVQGVLWMKSNSLDLQELSRTQNFLCPGLRRAEGLYSQDRELGVQQTPSSQEPLHSQPQQALESQVSSPKNQETPKEQERRDPDTLLPPNQRELKVQEVDGHFQGEQEMPQLPELRRQLWRKQNIARKVGILEPQWLEEGPQAVQYREWRETAALPGGGSQLRTLLAPGMGRWNQENLEPAALSRRLGASPSWEEEATETWTPTAMSALSPPSPGRHGEEPMWEPAALSVGASRETSAHVAPPGSASGLSSPPPPCPPCREKAFIWLSRQEKEAALRRLAELQAEGGRRHQRDKERQILRFQERLSIAKHRKSEEDLLGVSPAELRPLPAADQGQQDQAGQKTAVKRHLEKVKRERTYVMQSKRERNTLRFKELLLNPLAARGEEHPEPGWPGDA